MSRRVVMLSVVLALLGAAPAGAATIVVDELFSAPADGGCGLEEAVEAADTDAAADGCAAGSGADTIVVPAGEHVLSLSLFIETDLTIAGAGAAVTTVRPAGPGPIASISGTFTDVVFERLTLTGGHPGPSGPGAPRTGTTGQNALADFGGRGLDGGAIKSSSKGELVFNRVIVRDNEAGAGGTGGNATGGSAAAAGETCTPVGLGSGGTGGTGGNGGGVYHEGAVVVRDSLFSGNRAGAGGAGGNGVGGTGAQRTGFLSGCTGGTGYGGGGGRGGDGGAIYALGTLTIERSRFVGNVAGAGGPAGTGTGGGGGAGGPSGGAGGQGGAGGALVGGPGGTGGVYANDAFGAPLPAQISDSLFEGNAGGQGGHGGNGIGGTGGFSATVGWFGGTGTGSDGGDGGYGGAIGEGVVQAQVARSLFVANHSGSGGTGGDGTGGVGGSGNPGNTGGDGVGGTGGRGGLGSAGALTGSWTFADTTLTQNVAGDGGSGGDGTGGKGGNSSSGGPGYGGVGHAGDGGRAGGGALYQVTGETTLHHVTVAANAGGVAGSPGNAAGGQSGNPPNPNATGSTTQGAAGAADFAGGLINGSGQFTLAAAIVASNLPANCRESFVADGPVIRFGDETCPGTTADPLLSALVDNGGPTRTLALGEGSPARDVVTDGCSATDQRGVARPTTCDAGAYEASAPLVATGGATGVSASAATLTGVVTSWFGAPTYRFEYGTTGAYGSSTEALPLGGGLTATDVSAAIGGLAPATTYHYRLVASNQDGTAAGADRTFTTAAPGGGDTTSPVLESASLAPKRFRVDRKGAAETPVAAAKKGTRFSFALSEQSRVVFAIQRRAPGRRVDGRCVKPSAKNRQAKRCKRWKLAGRFATDGRAGANTKRFSGRIGAKRLRPGRHRATLIATDAAGNASAPRRLRFRVVRR